MTKWKRASISLLPLTVFLAVIATPKPQAVAQQTVLAQATAPAPFSLPQTVEAGTKVAIDGSSSAEKVSTDLKQQFEKQYPGTQIAIAEGGSDAALQALKAGKIDLAALGRPLTEAEKAEGLVAVPVGRTKIAMIVGPDSPFKGSLTIEQFAKIFRGEVTNWSQVGGPSAPVRIVDRPDSSDTRQAFPNYPVFRSAPFKTGANAVKVEDTTPAVAEKLGKDGVGYAIADQAATQPNVRIIQMHGTLPDDPRYPFSQPLFYVYKGPQPSPAARAFLGFAVTPEGQRTIVAVSPAPVPSASVEASPPADKGFEPAPAETGKPTSMSPLWWLLLPLLGLPLLALLWKGRNAAAPAAVPVAAAAAAAATRGEQSRIVLTPRNCRDAYAYWELTNEVKAARNQRSNPLMLRLYDVTGINLDRQQAHSMKQFEIADGDVDKHLPIELDDRDYLVDLGYTGTNGEWVKIARSEHVRVPKCAVGSGLKTGVALTGAGVAAAAAAATLTGKKPVETVPARVPATVSGAAIADDSKLILVPRNCRDAYAYWELSDAKKAELTRHGRNPFIRLYEVTNIDMDVTQAHSMKQFELGAGVNDMHLPIAVDDRDYLVELGYTTSDNSWVKLARSEHVRVPACTPADGVVKTGGAALATGMAATGAAIAGATAAGTAAMKSVSGDRSPLTPVADAAPADKIILVPRNSADVYAYWEVSEAEKVALRNQGGKKLALRLYDVTDINLDVQTPHSVYEYAVSETDLDRHLPIRVSDRDYLVELGYLTDNGTWLKLGRSKSVRVSSEKARTMLS